MADFLHRISGRSSDQAGAEPLKDVRHASVDASVSHFRPGQGRRMSSHVLAFPCGEAATIELARRFKRLGCRVTGAASLALDPSAGQYDAHEVLPHITAPDFEPAFWRLVRSRGIDGVVTTHRVVWRQLKKILEKDGHGAMLLCDSPEGEALRAHRAALREGPRLFAEAIRPASAWGPSRPPLSPTQAAALLRHFALIPGQCDLDKLAALDAVMRVSPPGDVVEIGCLWGKSAFALGYLARHYDIGRVLCVDPWSAEHIVQHDAPDMLIETSLSLDFEEAVTVFEMNLAPYFSGTLNSLRASSMDALAAYGPGCRVSSQAFGTTRYQGEIAVLHIDGNHDFAMVDADVRGWTPRLAAGGWVVIDDYTWGFGDGPRRVADAFLESRRERITAAFVAGGALFVCLAGAASSAPQG